MTKRINSRSKGANGELEFCQWLYTSGITPNIPKRNIEQVRSGGIDVIPDNHPFAYEVKRVEKIDNKTYDKWWYKANIDARPHNREAVVAHRRNDGNWIFLISVEKLLGIKGSYAIVKIMTFTKYAQKRIAGYSNVG